MIDRERIGWLSKMIRVMRMLAQDPAVIASTDDDEAKRALETMIDQCQALHDELLAALLAEDKQPIPY